LHGLVLGISDGFGISIGAWWFRWDTFGSGFLVLILDISVMMVLFWL